MDQVDHIGNRVTTCTFTGLIIGASTATYKALPLFQTSVSIAGSFALTSTACLIPERLLYHASFYVVGKERENNNHNDSNDTTSSLSYNKVERRRLFASHIGGGIIGGSISGSLYQRRFSWTGMVMFTPIMLGVAFAELYLQDYRRQRLEEIKRISSAGDS